MSRQIKPSALAAILICLIGGFLFVRQSEKATPPAPATLDRKPAVTVIEEEIGGRFLTIRPAGDGMPLRIAMDEVRLKQADGTDMIARLEPPATSATLGKRLREFAPELEAMPVAYPDNEERSDVNRRIVTRDLRVQIPDAEAAPVAAANRLEVADRPAYAPGWVIMRAADPLAALAAVDGLRATAEITSADVLLAKRRFPKAMPNDTLIGNQWHLKKIASSTTGTDVNIENAWKYGLSGGVKGAGIRIGIVDDGLETAHPDLAANVDTVNDKDWNGNDLDPNPGTDDDHGTACAGVAGARGNNNLGVSGTAPEATLVGMRLIAGGVTDAKEAEAMNWASDIIQVKSNSWGPSDNGTLLDAPEALTAAAFANATTNGRGGKGTIFVWAGGNGKVNGDNSNYDGYANSIYTIGVGAINSSGVSSSYSESGANLLVVAPSSGGTLGITTTDRSGGVGYVATDYTSTFGGTSSATPAVAGIIALMLEKNPNLGWRDVQEILFRSAAQFSPADSDWRTNGAGFKFNHKFGGGLVNATAAVDMAGTWTNLPAQTLIAVTQSGASAIPENNTAGFSIPFLFTDSTHRVERVTVKVSATHTARGNLKMTLTSPSGMVSRLAEVHGDINDNYSNWTFSTVHHWGEIAAGTWMFNIADVSATGNTTGGTLTSCEVRLHGSATGPVNPPPQVSITSPITGQGFSTGSQVTVEVAATDLAIDGSPGVISQVALRVDNVSIQTDTVAPYSFTFSPANGTRSLVARATDSAGAVASSSAVVINVQNQPPVISSVTLSAIGQEFVDAPLSVSNVTAADPEASSLTYTYQWQSSLDQNVFTNAAGQTTATLPASPANSGRLWRCLVTVSDGVNSAAFHSPAVNLLDRPVTVVKPGTAYSYDSGLVLQGVQEIVTRRAIINEFSQGPAGGTSEWVELLVLQQGSLVSWKLRDTEAITPITFKSHALWSNVPAGTLIVIYNGYASPKDPSLPGDDFSSSDGRIVLGCTNTDYFTTSNWIALGNSGDSITLLSNTGSTVHGLSYGANMTHALGIGPVGSAKSARFITGSDAAANIAANWTTGPNTPVTPGAGNNTANIDFIGKLRSNELVEIPKFRLGAGSDIPADLTLDTTTGILSGTISESAAPGNHTVIIERSNSLDEVVSQTYTLRIFPANYAGWITANSVANSAATYDGDGDALPNLVEYKLDLNPAATAATAPVVLSSDETSISLTYRESKLPLDAALSTEWSASLDPAAVWQSAGITTVLVEEDASSKLLKASLPIVPGEPKRFLRLKAYMPPP